jgi:hypothetical protein
MWYDPERRQLRATGHSVWLDAEIAQLPDADPRRRRTMTELQTALDNLADDMRTTRVDSVNPAGAAPGGALVLPT